jgi:enolase
VLFTNEFIVEFDDGSVGVGASSQGETISIYEDKKVTIEPKTIIETIREDGYLGLSLDLATFDEYLQNHISYFGRNNVNGLSLAFFNAVCNSISPLDLFNKPQKKMTAPYICLNILNGGWHAYTNPVLSDFHEYILVSKSNNPEELIANHNEIQRVVKERLLHQTKTVVSGNPVNCFATRDNRECIDFLLNIRDSLGLSDQFDLMIDASGGDLLTSEGYRLSITDNSVDQMKSLHHGWLIRVQPCSLGSFHERFC